MSDNYPLSILDHRISMLRERIHEMSNELLSRAGAERTALSERISAANKELDDLIEERAILAADAR